MIRLAYALFMGFVVVFLLFTAAVVLLVFVDATNQTLGPLVVPLLVAVAIATYLGWRHYPYFD